MTERLKRDFDDLTRNVVGCAEGMKKKKTPPEGVVDGFQ